MIQSDKIMKSAMKQKFSNVQDESILMNFTSRQLGWQDRKQI